MHTKYWSENLPSRLRDVGIDERIKLSGLDSSGSG